MRGARHPASVDRPTLLRSEAIEAEALRDLHEAAPAPVRDALGLRLLEIDGILVSMAAREPSIVINRTLGLGLETPATRERVEAVCAAYAEAGVERYLIHLAPDPDPPELVDWVRRACPHRHRGWMKFVRGREPAPEAATDLRIERIGAAHAAEFGRIAAAAFGLQDAAVPLLAALADRPRWRLFMSFEDERPAGTGALFLHEGAGWTDWGATDAGFRRRGSQRALLARRVAAALEAGCDVIFTETGEEVEGEPQHSYRNILRAGFREAFVKENRAPTPAA